MPGKVQRGEIFIQWREYFQSINIINFSYFVAHVRSKHVESKQLLKTQFSKPQIKHAASTSLCKRRHNSIKLPVHGSLYQMKLLLFGIYFPNVLLLTGCMVITGLTPSKDRPGTKR